MESQWQERKKKLVDKLGTFYIVFIIAVPSLAYIFLFKAIGGSIFKLPTVFDLDSASKLMYILPIISLALPQIGNVMKWLRRYMIDQMNSDYVKFARSGGLTENEIFTNTFSKMLLFRSYREYRQQYLQHSQVLSLQSVCTLYRCR